ncbi:MAG: peptidase S8 [Chloroflexi bacterium]|jgi:subtilisin family serine protease|nr:peptidase S8 [Chloroflexota bacterium]
MKFYRLLNLGVVFALVATMVFPASLVAYADEGGTVDSPPAEEAVGDEAPVADETSGEVQPVKAEVEEVAPAESEEGVEELPAADEAEPVETETEEVAPVEAEEIVEEVPVADEVDGETEIEETSLSEEESTPTESASVPIVVMDTEGTIIGVVNEDGEALALVSIEAVEILEDAEPLTETVVEALDATEQDAVLSQPLAIPDDLAYDAGDQYGLDKIQAPQAWGITTGSPSVIIAVIDTGFDLNHPDLLGKFIAGYDFVDNDADPSDPGGEEHGTHVAGIAAAVTNNATGMAGTSWGSLIMPIRVCDSTGCSDAAIANGIIWAANNGATVINLSLGGELPDNDTENAINYAYSLGVTIVAAAGNCDLPGYTPGSPEACAVNFPAAYSNVIAVGASDETNTYTDFSSYYTYSGDPQKPEGHQGVDVVAPGANIYSTVYDDDYVKWNGTSMATPFVSGVAALLASLPEFDTPDKIRDALLSTALDLGTPGWDADYGFGLVQAYDALMYTPPAPPAPPPVLVVEEDGDGEAASILFDNASLNLTQDADGTVRFFFNGADGNTPIGTLKFEQWSGTSAGTVLLNISYPDLGILLRVTALGSNQFLVQIYSLVDGALLSDIVITL